MTRTKVREGKTSRADRKSVREVSRPDSSVTRARVQRSEVDQRVFECIELMTAGEWVPGKTHRVLARKHGKTVAAVQQWAVEASRVIRFLRGDEEDLRTRFSSMLEMWTARMAKGDTPKHAQAAVGAIEANARLLGLVTQKHEVHVTVSQFEALSREQKITWLEERIEKLTQAREMLLQSGSKP